MFKQFNIVFRYRRVPALSAAVCCVKIGLHLKNVTELHPKPSLVHGSRVPNCRHISCIRCLYFVLQSMIAAVPSHLSEIEPPDLEKKETDEDIELHTVSRPRPWPRVRV